MTTENNTRETIGKVLLIGLALLSLFPFISSATALVIGIVYAQLFENPYAKQTKKATGLLLKLAVIGLGFGMNVYSAISAGKDGFILTIFSIFLTLALGFLLGKLLKIDKKISYLVSSGTAICGGSAIAAVSPVIKADEKQISVALGIVFILNSVALIIFPPIGHALGLSQVDFGLWSAIAIHDTSSVVGAAAKYGDQALEVATTVKLARALWVIPVAFLSMVFFKNKGGKVKLPYFIGLFVLAMLANSYIPAVQSIGPYIVEASKAALTLTLFLIGTSLSYRTVKSVGFKPLLEGVGLWIFISVTSLLYIMYVN
ncbi:putative sulfate exporter family transporter [Myroides odoratimimus]|uniref:YeiH family protein n=1 Tax=Myroides odoratimimus TaxID=76832 RepID=UPI0025771370|nr:putative sulfate exporter family transporter [Myroides odoratimimus]MDM1396828.1 putative sulfate exporter family transporter [Myroides odoratimimus]MDM1497140.1 putative sulfate exporter family transporter [Myroides odoratimimus]MDM1530943.1 putative sulfate exporter family transporter [Myroides odoratimimus]